MHLQKIGLLTLVLSFFLSDMAQAKLQVYNEEAFLKAQSENHPIVLQFHADWCPTCRKQKKSISKIIEDEKFKAIEFFEVNYDKESDLKKRLSVTGQSTLIYFSGQQEKGRSQNQTDLKKISSEIERHLLKM